ncbi:EthD family reductase [Yersinia enterocolitica]|uniref:EthD family reductase n=1 Tax=Yersinia enterocolitica TaxID=630 RepID=UPI0005DB01C8|nr:EthD family reductase [Yersinia enterocolitica]EKN4072946.1 EthD family reductase [Yersinia enterocolitica]EKN4142913.1 EthD family reductase [Yersinia enterocolitica]EKN4832097.1 EthD family reductase [Yersinia enterocolitica]EKN4854315.1 EthD family reductase [Yersinia enterocolitica]EKN6059047.1 EthD family reductase [Yersinia enterocolitica]
MTEVKGFKHVGLLTKKKDQSFDDFVEHWKEIHTAITLKLPGLRAYVLNPIDRRVYPDSPIYGFSELWFDSLEDAVAAFDSPIGKAAFIDVPNFVDAVAVTYVTEIKKL